MPRFSLQGPRRCTIFCFVLIHYTWFTYPTRFYWLVPQYGVNNYYVLCTVKAKKANKNIQQRTLSSFITIFPSINYELSNECLSVQRWNPMAVMGKYCLIPFQTVLWRYLADVTTLKMHNLLKESRLFLPIKERISIAKYLRATIMQTVSKKPKKIMIIIIMQLLSGANFISWFHHWIIFSLTEKLGAMRRVKRHFESLKTHGSSRGFTSWTPSAEPLDPGGGVHGTYTLGTRGR